MNNNNNTQIFEQNSASDSYFFEGAEKRLEVQFSCSPSAPLRGMLSISKEKWQKLLSLVNCQILSISSNSHFTAFVLSESSLFVFTRKIMIKTCGNTTLLECLPLLQRYAEDIQLSVDSITYSHKNFVLPQRQMEPYRSFDNELEILNKFCAGQSYVLGPSDGRNDCWFIFQSNPLSKTSLPTNSEQKIEILMTELDRKAMANFYKSDLSAEVVSVNTGISNIIPHSHIDGHMFDPCGYSMNGMLGEVYSTIHITPEAGFSYVSYECNLKTQSYDKVIKKVLSIFKPAKFMVIIYSEKDSLCKSDNAFTPSIPGFKREDFSKCSFSSSLYVSCSQFSLVQ